MKRKKKPKREDIEPNDSKPERRFKVRIRAGEVTKGKNGKGRIYGGHKFIYKDEKDRSCVITRDGKEIPCKEKYRYRRWICRYLKHGCNCTILESVDNKTYFRENEHKHENVCVHVIDSAASIQYVNGFRYIPVSSLSFSVPPNFCMNLNGVDYVWDMLLMPQSPQATDKRRTISHNPRKNQNFALPNNSEMPEQDYPSLDYSLGTGGKYKPKTKKKRAIDITPYDNQAKLNREEESREINEKSIIAIPAEENKNENNLAFRNFYFDESELFRVDVKTSGDSDSINSNDLQSSPRSWVSTPVSITDDPFADVVNEPEDDEIEEEEEEEEGSFPNAMINNQQNQDESQNTTETPSDLPITFNDILEDDGDFNYLDYQGDNTVFVDFGY